jgi:hypothetical protein
MGDKRRLAPSIKIAFFTNTFLPHVGGVAKSVQTFLEDYRRLRQRGLCLKPTSIDERADAEAWKLPEIGGSDSGSRPTAMWAGPATTPPVQSKPFQPAPVHGGGHGFPSTCPCVGYTSGRFFPR